MSLNEKLYSHVTQLYLCLGAWHWAGRDAVYLLAIIRIGMVIVIILVDMAILG